jgi:hypothetical protein
MEDADNTPEVPSEKQNSWGALIAIVVIMAIIVVGAFYAWGKRVAEERGLPAAAAAAAGSDSTTTINQTQ